MRVGSPVPKFMDSVAIIGGFIFIMYMFFHLLTIDIWKPLHDLKLAINYQRLRRRYSNGAQEQFEQDELFEKATTWKFKARWCLMKHVGPFDCCCNRRKSSELYPEAETNENEQEPAVEKEIKYEVLARYYDQILNCLAEQMTLENILAIQAR